MTPEQNYPPETQTPGATTNEIKTSKSAIWSLICGVSGAILCLPAIPAMILGIIALLNISKSKGLLKGSWMAITGLILSITPIVTIPALAFILTMYPVSPPQAPVEMPKKIDIKGQTAYIKKDYVAYNYSNQVACQIKNSYGLGTANMNYTDYFVINLMVDIYQTVHNHNLNLVEITIRVNNENVFGKKGGRISDKTVTMLFGSTRIDNCLQYQEINAYISDMNILVDYKKYFLAPLWNKIGIHLSGDMKYTQVVAGTPANGAINIPITAQLSWVPTASAESYNIYLGATNPPPYKTNTGNLYYKPDGLLPHTTYYWRIDGKSKFATINGEVWSFDTGN
jgi:hypothetical protein